MIGVHGATAGYRAAVAGLPLSLHRVDDPRGAIAIVSGSRGWAERSVTALRAGAAAIAIADPVTADDADIAGLADLADMAGAAANRVPIVLDRPRIRADAAVDAVASASPRYTTADVAATSSELDAVVRDAVGWLRMLTGGRLVLRAGERSTHGLLALLEEPISGVSATMTASVLAGRGNSRLRAQAVGETRVEVDIDAAVDILAVDISTVQGTRRVPRRREAHERLALRRAVAALEQAEGVDDLEEFRHDAMLAALLRLHRINEADLPHRNIGIPE